MLRGEKGGFKKSIKKGMQIEAKIYEAQVDFQNKVPNADQKLQRLVKEQQQFVTQKEGRIFHDFVKLIETGLPKLQEKIDKKREELLKQKVKSHKIRSEKLSDLFVELTDSPHLRRALGDYIEMTDYLWKRLEGGVDAYVQSVKYGLEAKGYSPKSSKHRSVDQIAKDLKKELLPEKKIGYYPQYNYNLNADFMNKLMPHMERLTTSTRENLKRNEVDIDSAIKEITGYIADRAKHRKKESNLEYSFNFPAVLKKYSDEMIRFNYVNHSQAATRKGLLEIKNMYRDGKVIDNYGTDLIQQILDLNATQTGANNIEHPEFKAVARAIGNFEYSSKIGGNVTTPAKNLFQRMAELVYFGRKAQKNSKELYENDPELLREVDRLMEESGIKFVSTTPELLEVSGSAMGKARIKISGMGEVEFRKPSKMEKTADLMGKVAGHKYMSWMMQKSENWNRKGTFRVSFAQTYNELMNSPGFAEYMAKKGVTGDGLRKEIISRARNMAIKGVSMIHYDYESIAKSKMLNSPTGRVLFQFQHYLQKMSEFSKDVIMGGKRSLTAEKGFDKLTTVQMQRVGRLGMFYMMIPGILSAVTGIDVGNLIEFAPKDKLEQLYTLLTGDGDEIAKVTFQRGTIVGGVLPSPFLGTVTRIGEIAELWKLDEDSWAEKALGYQDYGSATNEQKYYSLLKTIWAAGGKYYGQTMPLLLGGHGGMAAASSLSLYPMSKKRRKEQIEKFTDPIKAINPKAVKELEKLVEEIQLFHGKTIERM